MVTKMTLRPNEISNIIGQEIIAFKSNDLKVDNVGTVLQVGDGIVRVYGLSQVMAGELLEFEEGTVGIALNLENDNVGAVLMSEGRDILEGMTVRALGKIAQIECSSGILGRVVNSLRFQLMGRVI